MPGRNYLSLLVAALIALGVASCGGNDESTTAQQGRPEASKEKSADTPSPPPDSDGKGGDSRSGDGDGQDGAPRAGSGDEAPSDFTPKPHDDSGGGAEQFRVKGGDNSVQEFGAEAKGSEFERGAAALHNFFDARAAKDWAAACEYLASGLAKSFEEAASQATKGKDTSCATGLEALTNPDATQALRSEAAQIDVGSVRIEGETGFAIYRVGDTTYAISIAIEDGAFKVAALAGLPLN